MENNIREKSFRKNRVLVPFNIREGKLDDNNAFR